MRNVLRAATLAGLLCVIVFGTSVILESNDLQRFMPQQTQSDAASEQAIESDAEIPENAVVYQNPSLYIDGQEHVGTCDVVYVHENGFEVGKEAHKDATVTPDVAYDEQGRVSSYSVRITPDTVLMYSVAPAETVFTNHEFANNAPLVPVTDYTWRNAMHPYLGQLASYVRESGNDIVMVIGLEYAGENDRVPHYIDLKAFSAADLGATCNTWVTFYNYEPDRQVDYVTGDWYENNTEKTEPVTTDGESAGDANG